MSSPFFVRDLYHGINTIPIEIEPFVVDLSQAVGHPLYGNLLEVPMQRCNFQWSSIQDRLIVSNDTCNASCWNVSEVNNSITECLVQSWTHLLCFDQIIFTNRVGMPLVMNGNNDLWFLTFVIKYCLAWLTMRG